MQLFQRVEVPVHELPQNATPPLGSDGLPARSHISPDVQQAVRRYVHTWDGEDPGLSTAWLADTLADLDEANQPTARLALLVAVAPYRVDEQMVNAFQKNFPGTIPLLALSSWASFLAVQAISVRLPAISAVPDRIPAS